LTGYELRLYTQVTALAQRNQVGVTAIGFIAVQVVDGEHIPGGRIVWMVAMFTAPPGAVFNVGGYVGPVCGVGVCSG